MQATVFRHGFNRVEHHQIVRVERGKLQRLLELERRIIETLIASIKRQIETKQRLPASVEMIWSKIQNHELVQSVAVQINRLTDAYPQFSRQVESARLCVKRKAFTILSTFGFINQDERRASFAPASAFDV